MFATSRKRAPVRGAFGQGASMNKPVVQNVVD